VSAPEVEEVGVVITLLGDVAAHTTDTERRCPARLTSAKARLALAMLTVERHQGVRRDALADALWPQGRPVTWASALRNAVSRVHRHLVAALGDDPLVARDGVYRLRLPAGVRVDVEVGERQVVDARRALETGHLEVALASATEAAGWLGGAFPAGDHGDWVDAQRARLAALRVAGLEAQAEAALAVGDNAVAASAAQEAIGHEPLRETGHRLLLAAYAASGNRAAALRAYQHLRRVLADELGVDPDAETEAAYLRLLGPGPPAALPAPARGEASAASAPVPLVGREPELAAALDTWAHATAGRQTVLLVTGEAGIGKSRLLAEVAERIAGQGALVLFGRCDADGLIPHQPFVEMLDALMAEAPDDEIPDLSLAERAELAGVFPAFSRWRVRLRRSPRPGAPVPCRRPAGDPRGARPSPAHGGRRPRRHRR
jgi:DNA-binding SARP family transcriptional activator